jgi:hypothetical protein
MTWILETSVTTTHLIDDVMSCLALDFVFHVELYACFLQGILLANIVRHNSFVMFICYPICTTTRCCEVAQI